MNLKDLKNDFFSRVPSTPFLPKRNDIVYSDIVSHLPVLEYYASQCKSVAEFGVRDGQSTVALYSGLCSSCEEDKEMYSFDIEETDFVKKFPLYINYKNVKWSFSLLDTGSTSCNNQVPEVDMLFVDTLHTYEHISKELSIHGRKAKRFLAFHDTITCGVKDISGPNPDSEGIIRAIEEFIKKYGDYYVCYETECCNGLLILERVN